MKTAKEWVAGWPTAHTSCVYVDEDDVEAIQADARAEGRREGLLEAAKVCSDRAGEHRCGKGGDNINQALEAATCERLIRKLIEAEKGGAT